MSKFKIIILTLVIAGSIAGYIYYRTAALPSVTLSTNGSSYLLYNSVDKKTITEISSPTTIKLHDGYYCGIATDQKYDNTPLCFTVFQSNTSYVFDASYSSGHLQEILPPEIDLVNNIIKTKYANIINGYTICPGALYAKGDIYGTAIIENPASKSDSSDVYRVVLRKKGSVWEVVNKPVIVLDKTTFSEIPLSVLKKVNNLNVCKPDGVLESSQNITPPVNNSPTPPPNPTTLWPS